MSENCAVKIKYADEEYYISNDRENERSFLNSAAYQKFLFDTIREIKAECGCDLFLHYSCFDSDDGCSPNFCHYNERWPWRPWIDDDRSLILLKDSSGKYFEIAVKFEYFDDLNEIVDQEFVNLEEVEGTDDWQPDAESKIFLEEIKNNSLLDETRAMTLIGMTWWEESSSHIKEYIDKFNECEEFDIEWIDIKNLNIA